MGISWLSSASRHVSAPSRRLRRIARISFNQRLASIAHPVWIVPRFASWAALFAVYGVALAGIAFANVPHSTLASLVPAAYFVAVLANLATAAVLLLGTNGSAPGRPSCVLAMTFAGSAC